VTRGLTVLLGGRPAADLVAIEEAAGRLFATVGMDFVGEDDPGIGGSPTTS
jgi:hypothetical protein